MELKFQITNQKLELIESDFIVEKSKNYLTAQFDFLTPEYDGLVKTAVFYHNSLENPVYVILEGDRCLVPYEAICAGYMEVSVFAGDLIPTNVVRVAVNSTMQGDAVAPKEPTADVYTQILEVADNARAVAQSVRDDADSGAFNGEKGDKGAKGESGFIMQLEDRGTDPQNQVYLANQVYKVELTSDASIYLAGPLNFGIDNMILIYANITKPITINWGSNFMGDIPDIEAGSYIFLFVWDVFCNKWRCVVSNRGGVANA